MVSSVKKCIKSIIFRDKIKKQTIEDLQERLDWFIAHSDITTLKPATGYLRKKQLDLVEFADAFFSDIDNLGIHPFLICGNLIGAYRHKGFVPWDDDLDFGLIRSEYNKLIDFCKENYYVTIYEGRWSDYNPDVHLRRMNNLVKEHPNEYILDIWVDQLQIMKGTSCIDRLAIDFWSFDYYEENYRIEDHISYLHEVTAKKKSVDYVNEIVNFLEEEIKNNQNISENPTSNVFPGIDNVEGYLRIERTKKWLREKDLFPLKFSEFEGKMYYTPNNIEEWLGYEYPDYMSYPPDAGKTPHEGYKEKFILNNLPCVEFYLVDAFEIYHFFPLYWYFEKNGIYSCFVAEKPLEHNDWFDYDEAIKILDYNGVRYKNKPNYNVDCVFSTQGEYLIKKYKGKKIHLCYGVGLTLYSFSENKPSIENYDLKIVHGDVSYNAIRENAPNIRMIKAGYLRYTVWNKAKYVYNSEEKAKRIKADNCMNKPILLYFPTWDKGSSIDAYAEEIRKLKSRFYIVTKAHHCTHRLDTEEKHRELLREISDVVLEGNFSFEEAVKLGDLAICDAVSGSATEVPFLKKDMKMVLLYSPIKEKNQYKDFINEYACIVKDPRELIEAVSRIFYNDNYINRRSEIINCLYCTDTENALNEIKDYIVKNSKRRNKLCV